MPGDNCTRSSKLFVFPGGCSSSRVISDLDLLEKSSGGCQPLGGGRDLGAGRRYKAIRACDHDTKTAASNNLQLDVQVILDLRSEEQKSKQ